VRQHLDDVRVPGAREELGLGRDPGRDLDDHRPVIEVGLLSEEDPREPAPAQLPAEPVRADLIAHLGERDVRLGPAPELRRGHRVVQAEEPVQRLALRREPPQVVVGVGVQAGRLGQAVLLVDQLDDVGGSVGREAADVLLGAGRLAPVPAIDELVEDRAE
jgi:hypothetical protein